MQKTVYYCDQCKKIIGEKKHISLQLQGRFSGIAIPPDPLTKELGLNWSVKESQRKFMHFCKGECIGKYFDKLIAEK